MLMPTRLPSPSKANFLFMPNAQLNISEVEALKNRLHFIVAKHSISTKTIEEESRVLRETVQIIKDKLALIKAYNTILDNKH